MNDYSSCNTKDRVIDYTTSMIDTVMMHSLLAKRKFKKFKTKTTKGAIHPCAQILKNINLRSHEIK